MREWWQQRAPREQWLLVLAAIVAGAALLVQGVLVPSLHGREAARLAHAESGSTAVRLSRLAAEGLPPAAEAVPEAGQRAAEYAAEAGLVLKDAAGTAASLRFAFDPAAPTVVFSWIDRVETSLGLTVRAADITPSGTGQVIAIIEFSGAGAP